MAMILAGRKRGMTQLFDEHGFVVPCTVIELEKNIVTQIKKEATDGYAALQLGSEAVTANDPRKKEARTKKPQRGHFKKAGVEAKKNLHECRLASEEELDGIEAGSAFGVELFKEVGFVDVSARSKGKGFQGVMKLFNYKGGPASHGSSSHRRRGSQGMRTTPGRVFPGRKFPRRMGNENMTVQNLEVVKIDEEKQILVVKGAVPGPNNGRVYVTKACKK